MKNLIRKLIDFLKGPQPLPERYDGPYRAEMINGEGVVLNGNSRVFKCGYGITGIIQAQKTADKLNSHPAVLRGLGREREAA